jgi:hypothetical protein
MFTILRVNRWLDSEGLGDRELPEWAIDSGHSRLAYVCSGRVPIGALRQETYGFMGQFYVELIASHTVGIYFVQEYILVQYNENLCRTHRSGEQV